MARRQPYGAFTPEALTAEHVRGLPLHTVTDDYGTLGLMLRLDDTLAQNDLVEIPEVAWSVQFGLTLHANDTRTNGHYTDHLIRVTLRTIEHYGVTDPGIVAGCMLHDGPEDHAKQIVYILTKQKIDDETKARSLSFELIDRYAGSETAELVEAVTNPLIKPGEDKLTVYRNHTEKLVDKSPKARVAKLSDFTDNAVGNHYTLGPKQIELDRKYLDLFQIHRAGLFMPDSLIIDSERDYALQQLAKGQARALARIGMKR